jgi:hypothetical protein
MPKVTLDTAKAHLRVDGSDEDALIGAWIAAAYLAVEGRIFRKVYDTDDVIPTEDLTGIRTNEAINAAALLILGHLYANREEVITGNVSAVQVPVGADWLLTPYVLYTGGA